MFCSVLLLTQFIVSCCAQVKSAPVDAEDQAKQSYIQNQKQYYGYPLSRAFQTNRGAQQFTPVTEDQGSAKEQQFFSSAQGRQEGQSQDAFNSQQLQEQSALLQQQYLNYAQLVSQQQYLGQQPTAGRQAPVQQQQQQQQQYKSAESYPTLLGVRFSSAPAVAKTQFSGNGFSFSY